MKLILFYEYVDLDPEKPDGYECLVGYADGTFEVLRTRAEIEAINRQAWNQDSDALDAVL